MDHIDRINDLDNLRELFENDINYNRFVKVCKNNNIDLKDVLQMFKYGLIHNCEYIHKFAKKYCEFKFNFPLIFLNIFNINLTTDYDSIKLKLFSVICFLNGYFIEKGNLHKIFSCFVKDDRFWKIYKLHYQPYSLTNYVMDDFTLFDETLTKPLFKKIMYSSFVLKTLFSIILSYIFLKCSNYTGEILPVEKNDLYLFTDPNLELHIHPLF